MTTSLRPSVRLSIPSEATSLTDPLVENIVKRVKSAEPASKEPPEVSEMTERFARVAEVGA
jgi:hypothetical protein